MKSSMKRFADDAASKSTAEPGTTPILNNSPPSERFLGLVEEAAVLEQAGPLLGRDFDVPRRQQEDLVGDALHAAVERIREPAREVDQTLRELLVGALEVEDHRDRVLELVRDLLRIVEAPRDDEMDADGWDGRDRRACRSLSRCAALARRADHGGAVGVVGLGIRPVLDLCLAAAPRQA